MDWPPELDPLASEGWLAETGETFRRSVLGRCVVRRFAQGDTLYRAGDEAGGLFGLVDGRLGVIVAPGDRPPFLGIIARPGFWIGEGSVITRRPRAIGIMADRDSLAAYLPLAQWDAIVRADPEAWRWLAYLSLRNELFALTIVEALRLGRSEHRLAAMLVVLATGAGARQRGAGPDGLLPTVEISQDDLAAMANLSRSSVGRILDAFEARGLLRRSYRVLSIIDLEGLRRGLGG